MKKAREILGLPLISVQEAEDLGKVKDVLIDPDEGRVKYLMIMDHRWYLGAKVIAFDNILSIGEDAVTINSKEDLSDFDNAGDAVKLAEKEIEILGAKVFTEKGRYIGLIKEYYIDEEGRISACMLEGDSGSYMIESPPITSFGKLALVVEDSVSEGKTIEEDHKKSAGIASKEKGTGIRNSTKLFEEKQRQFLIGRTAKKRVLDKEGNVLLEEGQILTKEILDRVDDKNKIIELTINTK